MIADRFWNGLEWRLDNHRPRPVQRGHAPYRADHTRRASSISTKGRARVRSSGRLRAAYASVGSCRCAGSGDDLRCASLPRPQSRRPSPGQRSSSARIGTGRSRSGPGRVRDWEVRNRPTRQREPQFVLRDLRGAPRRLRVTGFSGSEAIGETGTRRQMDAFRACTASRRDDAGEYRRRGGIRGRRLPVGHAHGLYAAIPLDSSTTPASRSGPPFRVTNPGDAGSVTIAGHSRTSKGAPPWADRDGENPDGTYAAEQT